MSETGPEAPGRSQVSDLQLALERKKLAIDTSLRRRELQLKLDDAKRSRWTNPLVLAVAGAALAAIGNGVVTWMSGSQQRALEEERSKRAQHIQDDNNKQQLKLEAFKAESTRILEAIKTNNPDSAAVNLQFLLDAGLIANEDTIKYLQAYLPSRKPGQGPALPSPGSTQPLPRPGEVSSSTVQQLAKSGYILGIDTSNARKNLDFSALQQHGIVFIYVRATQAATSVDASAATSAASALSAGLKVGLYHIYDPTVEVDSQVQNFVTRLGSIHWDIPPAIDVADLGNRGTEKRDYSNQLKQFANAIQAATGVKPILYTTTSFSNLYLDDSMHDYALWLASYRRGAPPVLPQGWSSYLLWQLADGVSDDPVLAGFDINAFHGSIDDLLALGHRR